MKKEIYLIINKRNMKKKREKKRKEKKSIA
jgi:hypothetical protein